MKLILFYSNISIAMVFVYVSMFLENYNTHSRYHHYNEFLRTQKHDNIHVHANRMQSELLYRKHGAVKTLS